MSQIMIDGRNVGTHEMTAHEIAAAHRAIEEHGSDDVLLAAEEIFDDVDGPEVFGKSFAATYGSATYVHFYAWAHREAFGEPFGIVTRFAA